MKRTGLGALVVMQAVCCGGNDTVSKKSATIQLPEARRMSDVSVEATLSQRRSVRSFENQSLSLDVVGQLLWAAQGISSDGRRTAPSAGALYPLEVFVVASRVDALPAGVYRYTPSSHALDSVILGERRSEVWEAALQQGSVREAPAVLVITAVYERTAGKYGSRSERYVPIEVGCAAENASLQAVALGLGSVVIGAFDDARLAKAVGLKKEERPLLIIPVGKPRS